MNTKRIILILFFGLYVVTVNAQSESNPYFIPQIFSSPPNSAALGKYGNYAVNLFSGVPQISIPLYTIAVGGLNIPISLDYHASGITVKELASWAGLGWSLRAGGQISRKVKGAADEQFSTGYLNGRWRLASSIDPTHVNADYAYLGSLIVSGNNQVDGEPDIFSYDLPGKSGKFFFDKDNSFRPTPIPYSPVVINKTWDNLSSKLSFTVIDEQGSQFNLGQTVQEISQPGNNMHVTTSWMLESMLSQDKKDTISFSYTPQSATTTSDDSYLWVVDDHAQNYGNDPDNLDVPLSQQDPFVSNSEAALTVTHYSDYTTEQLVQQIKFRGGKLVFELSDNARSDNAALKSLKDIKVYSANPISGQFQLLKTIVFYQSYFIQGTDLTSQRLRLDSLGIFDNAGVLQQKYQFDYNTSVVLPGYSSMARDLWGYYNGKANSMLIPRAQIDYDAITATIGSSVANGRDPDTVYMQACILQKIHFPTGGYTEFQYETNKGVTTSTNTVALAGGLRVKSIKNYDGINPQPVLKTYQYGTNENGIGRANYYLNNYLFNTTQYYEFWIPVSAGYLLTQTKRTRSFLSNPSIDIEPYDAAPVVYPIVTEYTGDGVTNIGKTIYHFADHYDFIGPANAVKPTVESYFYERGMPTLTEIYKSTGSASYQLIHTDSTTYTAFPAHEYPNVGLVAFKYAEGDIFGYSTLYPPWLWANYSLNSDDNYPASKIMTDYDQNDPNKKFVTTIQYKYDNFLHQQVSRETSVDSKGRTHTAVHKFPADYIPAGNSATGNPILDTMLSKNMQASLIEKWDTLTNTAGTNSTIASGQHGVYRQLSPGGGIVLDQQNNLDIPAPVTDFQPAHLVSNQLQYDTRYSQLIHFDAYDAHSSVTQYTARNSPAASVLWDYNNVYPVAEVKNALLTDIAYTSFEADGTGNWTIGAGARDTTGGITGSNSYTLSSGATITRSGLSATRNYVVTYWSKNGALTITATTAVPGLVKRGWTYYQHTLPAGSTSVSLSGAGKTLDELKLYPADAQMTSYTYLPLIGQTSACTANDLITYYEYDAFGRLLRVRDMDYNILKQYQYQYQSYATTQAVWQSNGQIRCKPCPANGSYTTNMQQHQEIDINPQSATYNSNRWIDDGIPGSCVISPDWQNTMTAVRCQQSGGANDGYQEQEQKDMNPCSSTYNTTRWTTTVLNATACPYCNSTNCGGANQKCFGATCQIGTHGIVSQTFNGSLCTIQYGWFFSDGSYHLAEKVVRSGVCP